jgi:hypothetical protein
MELGRRLPVWFPVLVPGVEGDNAPTLFAKEK